MYLPYFPPHRPGQLVTSLPDDDIKEIIFHTMPNTWKRNMVEQGYNYLDDPIHSMAELFETRIENVEKSIQMFPQEKQEKQVKQEKIQERGSKKRKAVTFNKI